MENFVLVKLETIKERYKELTAELSAGLSTVEKLKEYSKLDSIIELYNKYNKVRTDTIETKMLYNDSIEEDIKELCKLEYDQLMHEAEVLEFELEDALTEKDPDDECNAIFEISGEVGGAEANLFARDLYDMYSRYCNSIGYTVEVIDSDETDLGGYNYISFKVIGDNAYGKFKYESGIHRVQRVPETEAKGRLHTSTASVMVTPEIATDKFELDLNDVEITTAHASGAGGQHINKTSSAIRAIYKPTGLTVFCQSRRSQLQNKEEAIRIIASKIKAEKEEKEAAATSANKSSKLGTRDRSEKIRTYNYPQNRITDHRIGISWLKLDRMMQGDLADMMKALQIEARKEN